MFSYKGIDNDYKYKRGSVDEETEIKAINKIKAEENILIIVSLKKVMNIKFMNILRSNVGIQVVNMENSMNNYTRKLNEKRDKRKVEKIQDEAEGKTLATKSPILKAISGIAAKIVPSKKIVVDQDMYNNLQNMFKEQSEREEKQQLGYSMTIPKDEFSTSKINEVKETKKRNNAEEKSINWNLLDVDEDDIQIAKNKKIKVKESEMIMFTRRLHIMLSSGVSLLSSLTLLQKTSGEKRSGKNLSKVLTGILDEIQLGSSFSEAIAKYPKQFNYAYVSLVAIGETSGSLDRSLSDIIKMKEQEQKIMRKIRTAAVYPMIVGFVLVVMMIGAAVFFLPAFETMFEEQGLSIPRFTQIVFGIAGFVPWIVLIITVLVLLLTYARKKVPEINYIYRRYTDKFALKFPVMKNIMNAMYMHSFSSTISLMLNNGIRLSDTLSLTGKTINNIYIKNEIEDIGMLMTHGLTFSEAMAEQPHFDNILVNIALTGEESGQMIFSLSQVADFFEIELNKKVDAMMEAVPPLSIFLIAILAAPVLIAAYLPILEMSSGAGLGL